MRNVQIRTIDMLYDDVLNLANERSQRWIDAVSKYRWRLRRTARGAPGVSLRTKCARQHCVPKERMYCSVVLRRDESTVSIYSRCGVDGNRRYERCEQLPRPLPRPNSLRL